MSSYYITFQMTHKEESDNTPACGTYRIFYKKCHNCEKCPKDLTIGRFCAKMSKDLRRETSCLLDHLHPFFEKGLINTVQRGTVG